MVGCIALFIILCCNVHVQSTREFMYTIVFPDIFLLINTYINSNEIDGGECLDKLRVESTPMSTLCDTVTLVPSCASSVVLITYPYCYSNLKVSQSFFLPRNIGLPYGFTKNHYFDVVK